MSLGLALASCALGCADRAPPARFPDAQPPALAKPLEAQAPLDQPKTSDAEGGDEGPAASEASEGSGSAEREGDDVAPSSDEPVEASDG